MSMGNYYSNFRANEKEHGDGLAEMVGYKENATLSHFKPTVS